jgi:probable phosphoglycerate mutase
MHLYLIRHGQSYVNLPDWTPETRAGLDAGLTERGHNQAKALAAWLPAHLPQIDALYASTMQRTRETAQYVSDAYGHDIRWDDRIREVGNNYRDGSPFPSHALPTAYSNVPAANNPFHLITPGEPDGESFSHFRVRVGEFLYEMIEKHAEETIVVVMHGGVLNVMFDNIFNVGLQRQVDVWEENTGITHFERQTEIKYARWRLYYMGKTEHLLELKDA